MIEPPEPGTGQPAPVEQIAPNPENPRGAQLDAAQVASMRESIARYGLLQALVVVDLEVFLKDYPEHKGQFGPDVKYVIVTGHIRHAAITSLLTDDDPQFEERRKSLREVRIDVQNHLIDDLDAIFHQENQKRLDLNVFEEALIFQRLQQRKGFSHAQIAQGLGVSKSTVTKRLKLLELNDAGRALVLDGRMQVATAYELVSALPGQPDLVVAAFELIETERLSPSEAVNQVVLAETAEPAAEEQVPGESAEGEIATGEIGEGGEGQDTAEGSGVGLALPPGVHMGDPAPQEKVQAAQPQDADSAVPEPRPANDTTPPAPAPSDDVRARTRAAALRERACAQLVAEYTPAVDDPQATLIAAGVITAASTQILKQAHRWMRAAGDPDAEHLEPSAYAATVVARGNAPLLRKLAYAVALAGGERQASDRRTGLSPAAIAHIRHLQDAGVYEPATEQERVALGSPAPASV
ncbi:ParB/RepB/Spo0J family partition protein [Spirillospora sp. NPDC127200]